MYTDVSKNVDASKKFFILEIKARIVTAFLTELSVANIDEESSARVPGYLKSSLATKDDKHRYLESLSSKIVDKHIIRERRNEEIIEK